MAKSLSKLNIVSVVEDVVVVAGTAVSTWQVSRNAGDVVNAVAAAPAVRGGVALLLSGGGSTRIAEAFTLLRQLRQLLNSLGGVLPPATPPAPAPAQTVLAAKPVGEPVAPVGVPA